MHISAKGLWTETFKAEAAAVGQLSEAMKPYTKATREVYEVAVEVVTLPSNERRRDGGIVF
jgi:hypothetical protein